jgi:choline dehydrogenase-like flavoprotein
MAFIDTQEMRDGSAVVADLCIVGAGAAGIALAKEFVGHSAKVVVLESGGLRFRHRPQFLYIGENSGIDNYPTTHSRFRMFGGSTTRWGGQCRPFSRIDFEAREGIPYSGWPFGLDHLEPYYRRAQAICNLGPCNYEPDFWQRNSGNRLSVTSDLLEPVIYQFSHPSDFGKVYHDELKNARNVDIYLNANVTDICASGDAANVTSMTVSSFSRKQIRFSATNYVLACGGIENPRLLLASDKVAARGLGNDYDLVGRFFMDHPYFLTGWYEPSDPAYDRNCYTIEGYEQVGKGQKFHAAFAVREALLREKGINGAALYFVRRPRYKTLADFYMPAGKSFTHLVNVIQHNDVPNRRFGRHILNVLRRPGTIMRTLGRQVVELARPRPLLALRSVVEPTPNPDSRVTLTEKRDYFGMRRVRVEWRLNASDRLGLACLLLSLRKEVERLKLGRLVEERSPDEHDWPISMTGGKHHMGTTRMHASPKLGVVDPDCRVHSVRNLYVAGSSVFPTGGFANPTLTIVALAVRLADHLKARMQSTRTSSSATRTP